MALRLGELVATLRADASGFEAGMSAAQLRMRGLTRDANGQLRTLRGRFISEGDAAGRGLSDGIREHAQLAVRAVRRVGPAIAGVAAGVPGVAAAAAALGGLAAGAVAAGLAVGAFKAAAGPQMEAVANVAKLAAEAEAAAASGAVDAAAKQKAYTDALSQLPPATREAAQELVGLKRDHKAWSDELSGTTMPVFTKGMQVLRSLLPQVTPFVKVAGQVFGDTLDRIAVGVRSAKFTKWATDTAAAAGPALSNFLQVIGNLGRGFAGLFQAFTPASAGVTGGLVSMTGAFADWAQGLSGSERFADFLELAGEGATTLGALGGAVVQLLVALGPIIGVTTQLALGFAQIINNTPTPVLTALAIVIGTVVVAMKLWAAAQAIVALRNRIWTASQWQLNAAMLANPMVLIVAGIVALIAVIVLIATKTKWFQKAWDAVWGAVKSAFRASVDGILVALEWLKKLPEKIGRWFGTAKTLAVRKMAELLTWLKGLPGRAWDALSGLGAKLGKAASEHFQKFRNAAASKTVSFITWVRELPGRIVRAIGSLSKLLLSKGKDVVLGLWNGIKSMGTWIAKKVIGWARDVIPGPIADALGIASPSKVTREQGKWVARGLAVGITGSSKEVRTAAQKLAKIVRDSLSGGREKKALLRIGRDSHALEGLARREENLAVRMKKATRTLKDMVKARDEAAASVRQSVLDAANITTASEGPVTADSILTGLNDQLGKARQFAEQIAILRKKGVRGDLIAQIAAAGVEGGLGAATALANATKGQIKEINSTQGQLVTAAKAAGDVTGDALYGAGIHAAKGLVRGLAAEQGAIERQMMLIAKGMTKAIKQALGIKSPSRVLADQVGRWIPRGIQAGIDAGAPALDKSMAALVTPPSVPALGGRPTGTRPDAVGTAGGRPIVLEIRSGGSPQDDFILESVQRSVRVRGGDVQLVIAGRR
ncbi:phage tail protein [Streptomyces jumonjinensis]|uniref:Phage tail protein n=1 Tax=Streptomyces jumonjinensis TaxID=1945 RepID=A0A646KNN8_STRJU|nr:hypothetical protein [Streptomyces jumonjinensis]MQT03855.1 hypothetical protein [Streptomyces jumonjinensis]